MDVAYQRECVSSCTLSSLLSRRSVQKHTNYQPVRTFVSWFLVIWVFDAIRQCQVWEELGGLRCVLYMALRLLLLFMLC